MIAGPGWHCPRRSHGANPRLRCSAMSQTPGHKCQITGEAPECADTRREPPASTCWNSSAPSQATRTCTQELEKGVKLVRRSRITSKMDASFTSAIPRSRAARSTRGSSTPGCSAAAAFSASLAADSDCLQSRIRRSSTSSSSTGQAIETIWQPPEPRPGTRLEAAPASRRAGLASNLPPRPVDFADPMEGELLRSNALEPKLLDDIAWIVEALSVPVAR